LDILGAADNEGVTEGGELLDGIFEGTLDILGAAVFDGVTEGVEDGIKVGDIEGIPVGFVVDGLGFAESMTDGDLDGTELGLEDDRLVGMKVDDFKGLLVGFFMDGEVLGTLEGKLLGITERVVEGDSDGTELGTVDGNCDIDGTELGKFDGKLLGMCDGKLLGEVERTTEVGVSVPIKNDGALDFFAMYTLILNDLRAWGLLLTTK